jgi:predicted nucleic acid-binding protein
MIHARPAGVVVDTMVISWLFNDGPNPVADHYRALINTQPVLLAFQTVMELRYGALRAGWGDLRRRRLERRVAELTVVQPDDDVIGICAELRHGWPAGRTPAGQQGARRRPVDRCRRDPARPAARVPRRRVHVSSAAPAPHRCATTITGTPAPLPRLGSGVDRSSRTESVDKGG